MATYVLVRDKDGHPKFDSYEDIAFGYWVMLTEDEQKAIINYQRTGVLTWQ